jgi:hypothetical protein
VFSILSDFRLKWFEYGTSIRKTKSSKRNTRKGITKTNKDQNRGIIRATPFFIPATENIKNKIGKMFEQSFQQAINKIINKQRNGK